MEAHTPACPPATVALTTRRVRRTPGFAAARAAETTLVLGTALRRARARVDALPVDADTPTFALHPGAKVSDARSTGARVSGGALDRPSAHRPAGPVHTGLPVAAEDAGAEIGDAVSRPEAHLSFRALDAEAGGAARVRRVTHVRDTARAVDAGVPRIATHIIAGRHRTTTEVACVALSTDSVARNDRRATPRRDIAVRSGRAVEVTTCIVEAAGHTFAFDARLIGVADYPVTAIVDGHARDVADTFVAAKVEWRVGAWVRLAATAQADLGARTIRALGAVGYEAVAVPGIHPTFETGAAVQPRFRVDSSAIGLIKAVGAAAGVGGRTEKDDHPRDDGVRGSSTRDRDSDSLEAHEAVHRMSRACANRRASDGRPR